MKKRILALLLVVVLALSLTACGGNKEPAAADPTQAPAAEPAAPASPAAPAEPAEPAEPAFEGVKEIVIGVGADIKSWDPWGNFNLARQNQAPLIYQNLTADVVDLESHTMTHYFILAESTEEIDELTYRIKLRAGIKDSAGNDFTAEDAIFSFEKCAEVSKLSQVRLIKSLELVDELTFDMHITNNTVGSFYDVCNAINMVTKEAYEASEDGMATNPVGTGPMVLTEYVSGSHAIFEKADSYWNDAANESKDVDAGYCSMWDFTNIDVVRYETITDTATMAIALESGDIDIARAIGMEDVTLFEGNDAFTLFRSPDAGLGVAFNASENSPLNNYNLRMALALAISSENALSAAADGYGEVAKSWSYKTFVDYQPEWESRDYFDYNLDAAKEYLAKWEEETGEKAADLSLRILLQNEDAANALALSIQADVGALTGNPNTVVVNALDRATFTQAKQDASAFEMFVVDSQIVTRSHSGFEWDALVNEAKMGYNCFHVKDDVLQEKLMAATLVSSTSAETVKDFEAYVVEQAYMKNLIYADAFGAAASWVGNLEHSTGAKNCLNLGALDLDWANSGK